MFLTAFLPKLFKLLGLCLLPFSLVRFNLLYGNATSVRSDDRMRPIHAYSKAPIKPLPNHTELVHTGDNHPSLGFFDGDQPFLCTRLEEYSQGLESRVLDIHRGAHGFCELKRTIWQDIILAENRWRDWEGPRRQFRQCDRDRLEKGSP